MAQRTIIQQVDDLTGESTIEPGVIETVPFSVNGVDYEIDLTENNREELAKAQAEVDKIMARFVTHGRRAGAGIKRGTRGRPTSGLVREKEVADGKAIREWARSHGQIVSPRGRVANALVAAYKAGDPTLIPGYDASQLHKAVTHGGAAAVAQLTAERLAAGEAAERATEAAKSSPRKATVGKAPEKAAKAPQAPAKKATPAKAGAKKATPEKGAQGATVSELPFKEAK